MGFPIARNIARASIDVRAWNRSRGKAEPLAQEGHEGVAIDAEVLPRRHPRPVRGPKDERAELPELKGEQSLW